MDIPNVTVNNDFYVQIVTGINELYPSATYKYHYSFPQSEEQDYYRLGPGQHYLANSHMVVTDFGKGWLDQSSAVQREGLSDKPFSSGFSNMPGDLIGMEVIQKGNPIYMPSLCIFSQHTSDASTSGFVTPNEIFNEVPVTWLIRVAGRYPDVNQ